MINTGETTSQALQAPYEADFSRVHFMFALPRSRTQWMCHFLAHAPNVDAWHDPLAFCRSPAHLVEKIRDHLLETPPDRQLFIADTAAVMFYRALKRAMPAMRVMTMRRDPGSVRRSLARQIGRGMDFMIAPCYERLLEIVTWELETGNHDNHYEFHLDIGDLAKMWSTVSGDRPVLVSWLQEISGYVIDRPLRDQPHSAACVESLLTHREVKF